MVRCAMQFVFDNVLGIISTEGVKRLLRRHHSRFRPGRKPTDVCGQFVGMRGIFVEHRLCAGTTEFVCATADAAVEVSIGLRTGNTNGDMARCIWGVKPKADSITALA